MIGIPKKRLYVLYCRKKQTIFLGGALYKQKITQNRKPMVLDDEILFVKVDVEEAQQEFSTQLGQETLSVFQKALKTCFVC